MTPALSTPTLTGMDVITRHESAVRSYVRAWPIVFEKAHGAWMYDADGRAYLDFFAGAGALNYGHNNPRLKEALIDHLSGDYVTHGLDMATRTKVQFLETLHRIVLEPRGLDYRVMFTGPTGTNAVEAALKLARLATGRDDVVHFSNSFHGMSLGSLAVTSNPVKRAGAGVTLTDTVMASFDDDGIRFLREFFTTAEEYGRRLPAAVIVETVQGEGGVNIASDSWLRQVRHLCTAHGVILIVDDIQMGCGRTGSFFSFEPSGIVPDLVTLSKSISGYGLPMALVLLKPELDVFTPGQHNGTFRGNNAAFATATVALETYWKSETFIQSVDRKNSLATEQLQEQLVGHPDISAIRSKGLVFGISCTDGPTASRIAAQAFDTGLLVETCGSRGEVVKLLPPLTITDDELTQGLDRLAKACILTAQGAA
ncbi:diaminobutyrate--2-oxoglutarate transaminase [Gordonia sp. N1V]|uniref:diaminobutyrate--2-oxoglutarate transaminase n=1 Tax=Gordonia sp. N1V TaxID=3034163 RepID=UPI0023E16FA5|nr:diaminobutyrate--2-oxoglutarate transaminase [Gordonia sp. N1V]MDF3285488.1 diaminobutyrate--2-oxoglutarate transaminase [Gordonia sp. N1V]